MTTGNAWPSKRLTLGIVSVLVVGVAVVFRAKKRTMKQAHSGHAARTHKATHQRYLRECDASMTQDLSNAAAGVN